MNVLRVRVSVPPIWVATNRVFTEEEITNWAKAIDSWLKYKNVVVEERTLGIHTELCSRFHFHYHLIMSNPFSGATCKKRPYQQFKLDIEKKRFVFPEQEYYFRDKSVSIVTKALLDLEDSGNSFLGYAVKELKPIMAFCLTIDDFDPIMQLAHAKWEAKKAKMKYEQEQKDKTSAVKQSINTYCDKALKADPSIKYEQNVEKLLLGMLASPEMRDSGLHPDKAMKIVEIWSWANNIQNPETLLRIYRGSRYSNPFNNL